MDRIRLGIAGCILTLLGVGGTLLLFQREDRAVHTISPGQVELSVTEPEACGEGWMKELEPGQQVDRHSFIHLEEGSQDAYIRVRLEYGGILSEPEQELPEERQERLRQIQELDSGIGISGDWIRGEDGFCYYQKKVEAGSDISFSWRIDIPDSWGQEMAEQIFTVDFTAEGIPADYFEPWREEENGRLVINAWTYTDGRPVAEMP